MCSILVIFAVLAVAARAQGEQSRPPLFAGESPGPPGKLPAQAIAGRSQIVRINHAALASGTLSLRLPGNLRVGAIRDQQLELGKDRFAWVGHAIGHSSERVVLGVSGNAVAGTVLRKGRLFKLEPRADGSHVLSEVNTSDPAPELDPVPVGDPIPGAGGGLSVADAPVADADAGQTIIDVLVAYTPAVQAVYGTSGTEAQIILAVAETNQAYANSGINARLNLVHTAATTYVESGDMAIDLDRLRMTNDGFMDELHTLRDSYGADLVSLIEDDADFCGFAYRMQTLSATFAGSAFSVVHYDCATGYYSFGHEIGHNQGAHHDLANASGTPLYPYAHGYQDPLGRFRTVMATDCPGFCSRVDHFSNPNVFYSGAPTGDASYADNARTLNNTAATVAAFRNGPQSQPPAAPSGLGASAISASQIQLAWVDESGNESGFYLERATALPNFSQIATLPPNTTDYLDGNLSAATFYYYRVRAFNSAGPSGYSDVVVTATDPAPPQPPAAPSNLVATATDMDSIALSWSDNSNNETGFQLQRRPDGSSTWTTILTSGAGVSSHLDTGLQPATRYHYRVRAFNDIGNSSYSNSSYANTLAYPPAKYLRQRDFFS